MLYASAFSLVVGGKVICAQQRSRVSYLESYLCYVKDRVK